MERDADRLGDYQGHQACDHRGLHQGDRQDRHRDADHQGLGVDRHQGVGHPRHQGVGHQDRDANRQDLDVIQEGQDANRREQYVDPGASQHLDAVVGSNEDHRAAAGLPDPFPDPNSSTGNGEIKPVLRWGSLLIAFFSRG